MKLEGFYSACFVVWVAGFQVLMFNECKDDAQRKYCASRVASTPSCVCYAIVQTTQIQAGKREIKAGG